jgi:hypothetical protein
MITERAQVRIPNAATTSASYELPRAFATSA